MFEEDEALGGHSQGFVLWDNASVLTPRGILPNSSLLVGPDGVIRNIGSADYLNLNPNQIKQVNLQEKLILPGLIDVHVHGGQGFEVMGGTFRDLEGMSLFHARNGTTAFLATTEAASIEKLEHVLHIIRNQKKEHVSGAELLGVHLEGPFLNPLRAGAQNKDYLKSPERELLERLMLASGGSIIPCSSQGSESSGS